MKKRSLGLILAAFVMAPHYEAHAQSFASAIKAGVLANPALTAGALNPALTAGTLKPALTINPSIVLPTNFDSLELFQPQFDLAAIKAIRFEAYSYQDPETGKAISGTTVLTLPNGSKLTAAEYYRQLNEHEKFLSENGNSLRAAQDNYGEVLRTASTASLLTSQKDLALRSLTAAQVSKADVLALSHPGIVSLLNPTLIGALNPGMTAPSQTCSTTDKVSMPRNWSHRAGNAEFNVQLAASAKFEATCNLFSANAEGKLDAAAFKRNFSVARGVLNAVAERNKDYRATLDVYVVGKKIWNYGKSQKNSFSIGDTYRHAISYEYSIKVPIGPVRAALTVGTTGDARFGYSFKFDGLSAKASVNPGVSASLFARGGVNVYVAEVGAGGSFMLVKLDMPMSLLAEVTPRSGTLYLHGKLLGSIDVETLSGRLYGYADVYVPRWGVPPWKKKHYEVNLARWNGLEFEKTLFNEEIWKKAI